MKVYAYIAFAVLILGAFGGTYLYGRSAGADAVRLEWEEANRVQRAREAAAANEAAQGLEVVREKERVVFKTITRTVDKYIDRVELRNVCFDPVGVCIANAAIGGTDPAPCGTARAVPASVEAGRRDSGISLALDQGRFGVLSGLRGEAPGS